MLPRMTAHTGFERKRYPVIMDHGTPRANYAGTPTSALGRASVQPGYGGLDVVSRDGAEIVFTLIAAPHYDVRHGDILHLRGTDYRVNGEPERWDTGILDHQVIRLSKWSG